MKKPFRGDGLAFSEMLYGDDSTKLASSCLTNNCSPTIAAKSGRNMAAACRSIQGDNKVVQKVLEAFQEQYCPECQKRFKQSFWKEMERENAK